MSKRVRIILGGLLLTLMTVNFGAHIYSMFLPPPGSSDGWSGTWSGQGDPKITGVNADGPATALQVGDEIIAINGIKIKDDPRLLGYGYTVPPGTRFTMTIRRAGELRDLEIQTVPHQWRLQQWYQRFNALYIVLLIFLLTAWAIFLLRPDDKQAWLLAVLLATLTGFMGQTPNNLPAWLSLMVGPARILGLLFLPVFVHLFLIFPERSPLLRRWPRLEFWLYAPSLLTLLTFGFSRAAQNSFAWVFRYSWLRHLFSVAIIVFVLYLIAGLICLAINYAAANADARRRLRVVMAGSAAGVFNLLLLVLIELAPASLRLQWLDDWLDFATLFTFPLIPLSFVYAILRHKVIPVSLIIRRSIRYLLVARGSVLLEFIIVTVMITVALTYIFERLRPSGIVIGLISAAVGIAAYKIETTLHRKFLAPIIDRKFFRQSYDAHQLIAELTNELRATTSVPQLVEQVATKIQTALQTESATILLRDDRTGDYLSNYSCQYDHAADRAVDRHEQIRLPHDAAILAQLSETRQPLELDQSTAELPALDRAALLLPLIGKDGMLGIIALGARLGDLPFSRDDKQLLTSVAGPTTFALENARLIEQMIEAARHRQELEAENQQRAKEMEEARQLQLSMLPKTVPQLPNLEIAAYMKTASEVGGDYYDFHLSDNGELTVVVGDATGHGLKAGTVVTAMKSLFRTFASEPDLVQVFSRSSRVLKEMNLRALFMGLTMIKLRGGQMRITSAGMPSVLIYRALLQQVEEVSIKAMPLGSVTSYPYREESVTLDTGDIIVLMSDGFPERFNEAGEMLGYDKAPEVLLRAAAHTPREIIAHFVAVGDEWADGRPQDDDVTLVVLKVK
jgi:serine phosphatase RsbU (regulator of sigma subunit)